MDLYHKAMNLIHNTHVAPRLPFSPEKAPEPITENVFYHRMKPNVLLMSRETWRELERQAWRDWGCFDAMRPGAATFNGVPLAFSDHLPFGQMGVAEAHFA